MSPRAAIGATLLVTVCAWAAFAEAAQVTPLEPGGDASLLTPDMLKGMVMKQGGAVFSGLDKVTARVTTVYAPLDVPVRYGTLSLTARTCHKRPPEETPEQTVFVEIDDMQPGAAISRAFTGWMFWSSPALNSLQHPYYDVWLIDCITNEPVTTPPPPAPPAEAAPSAPVDVPDATGLPEAPRGPIESAPLPPASNE